MKELDFETVSLFGTHLVEASAGCGKTYAIQKIYARLVAQRKLDVSQILVVTYTRAATAELRDRIRTELRGASEKEPDPVRRDHLVTALRSFDEAAVLTIHGFCQRALSENAFESRVAFDTELVPDLGPLVREVVEDYWTRELHDAPPLLVRYLRSKHVTPERFVQLARKVTADPHLPVLPERVSADVEGAERRWRDALGTVEAQWRARGAAVVELLCSDPGLNRHSYRAERIRSDWVPGIEAMFEATSPGSFDELQRLTPAFLAEKTKKKHTPPEHPFFDACAALLDAEQELERALRARLVEVELGLVRYAREELERRKEAHGAQGYDDLLHRLHAALRADGGDRLLTRLRRRYEVALIDEFQDTDPVQYDIFRRTFGGEGRALFLIGDPKQAIYAFRGADVFAYLEAAKDAADERHTLSTNRRSDPRLLSAVNALFGRARDPFLFSDIRFQPVRAPDGSTDRLGGSLEASAPLEILLVRGDDEGVDADAKGRITKGWGERALPYHVAAEIVRLLGSGATVCGRPVEPGDVAVLCRTNAQAEAVQGELHAFGVPAVLEGDRSVFETDDAESVERVLVAMASPRDAAVVRAALVTPILGVTGDELCALVRDEGAWEARLERFERWNRTFRAYGFVQAFRQMLEEERAEERLLARPDGERRLTNVLHLGELLHEAATRSHLGPQALLRWLEQMRRDASARGQLAADAAQIRLESDARAVRLTTIHKSKGLEYPIVYCPFLWNGRLLFRADEEHVRFHDAADGRRLKLDLGSASHDAHRVEAAREALAENLRLLYVALTRAKHRCTIVWGAFRHGADDHPALGYLLHQPERWDGDFVGAAREHLRGLDDDALRAEVDRLAEASAGTISARVLPLDEASTYHAEPAGSPSLAARDFGRSIDRRYRVSSFSGLVSAAESEAESWRAVVGRDDAGPDEDRGAARPPPEPVVLHDFPAGARAGLLLHELYEQLDFHATEPEGVRALAARLLARYGYDSRFTDPLARSVRDVLDTPLDDRGMRLSDVPRSSCLAEMEFTLPVRQALTPARLARVFSEHGAPAVHPEYAEQLARLGFDAMHGFLRGFVDLVFVHDGRFYLVDHKSNRLGDAARHYAPDRLVHPMAHHHYFLQYHLYVAALSRHLAVRVPGWDYDAGFGGVLYLFLRGMAPHHPPRSGVFADRPPRALVDGLVALLDEAGA